MPIRLGRCGNRTTEEDFRIPGIGDTEMRQLQRCLRCLGKAGRWIGSLFLG